MAQKSLVSVAASFSGSGDGYGSGDGSLKEAVKTFVSMLPQERNARAKQLVSEGATLAYWKSDKNGKPANGGVSESVSIGTVQKVSGPLNLCEEGTLHATYTLCKWKGERIWLVAMIGEVIHSEDKLGALEREIIAELTGGKIQ